MLYIVATPIGNLSDITLRAIEVLKSSDFIIAENPAHSAKLLQHYAIPKKKTIQFAEHNEKKVLSTLIPQLKSLNGALVTDAGTPGISDPGFRLVRACVEAGIKVAPIPGPSAAMAALSASGLPTDRFLFVGFLPRKETALIKMASLAKQTESTLIGYDSPFRIVKTVELLAKRFPQSNMVIARELTKIHEEFLRGRATDVLAELKSKASIKGEITLLISFK
ncbi:MAG: 16S rRNA (cytidine(1402)-2'-O)-methyltransferase [Candidatus Doudnabacteria bacterium]|nr:16S rRNA (cytidine(1402)-2'-O)-methyltransferase [Candidatus Doudnabacteria bacterium]